MPGKTRFMGLGIKSPLDSMQNANELFKDMVGKAKKGARRMSVEDRKRESLKKRIVVVGVTNSGLGMS